MATKSYEQMTKAELLKAIGFFKLEGKVEELGKEPDSLVNADYVKVLNEFKDSQDAINKLDQQLDENKSENKSTDKVENKYLNKVEQRELTKDEKMSLAAEYNFTKTLVVITDHDVTQSMEADIKEKGITISWGNKFLLTQTDVVFMHGKPQYVRNGALSAMRTMLIPTNSKTSTERTIQRFSITEVEGWSQEKIDELAAQQKLKGN